MEPIFNFKIVFMRIAFICVISSQPNYQIPALKFLKSTSCFYYVHQNLALDLQTPSTKFGLGSHLIQVVQK
jgi:hypothetical protein